MQSQTKTVFEPSRIRLNPRDQSGSEVFFMGLHVTMRTYIVSPIIIPMPTYHSILFDSLDGLGSRYLYNNVTSPSTFRCDEDG